MIEYCFVAGLVGLGIILNKNGKQERKLKSDENINSKKLNNVYNSNISQQAMQFEKELVQKKFNESKNPDTTNIIPDNYNQKILNEPKVEKPDVIVSKLTGLPINRQDFTHNNMVPFFGSNIKQNMDDNSNNWNNTQSRYDQLPVDVETINYAIKNLNDIVSNLNKAVVNLEADINVIVMLLSRMEGLMQEQVQISRNLIGKSDKSDNDQASDSSTSDKN